MTAHCGVGFLTDRLNTMEAGRPERGGPPSDWPSGFVAATREYHLSCAHGERTRLFDNFQLNFTPARVPESATGQWMALELAFETRALRDICECEEIAKRELGAKVADALKRRLSDFRSVDTVDELPLSKIKKSSNRITFELPDGWQLVVTAGHGENPKLTSGKIDWTKVTRLKITRIENSK